MYYGGHARSEDNLQEIFLSFHHVAKGQTQAVRFGNVSLYSLIHKNHKAIHPFPTLVIKTKSFQNSKPFYFVLQFKIYCYKIVVIPNMHLSAHPLT